MRDLPSTDEALLLSGEPEDFGCFYDRYVRSLLAYFQRRTRDPEAAADLTAETFAAALAARARFEARAVPASVWLFAIAVRVPAHAALVYGVTPAPAAGQSAAVLRARLAAAG